MNETILKGIPAAPGIAFGSAFILDKQEFIIAPRSIMEEEVPIEIARFEEALIKTRDEIINIKKKISTQMHGKHAQFFDAHLLVLEDRSLIEEVVKKIHDDKLSAEFVFSEVTKKFAKIFEKIEDEYLGERVSDINDVARRVLKNLVEESKMHELSDLTEELIIVSHDLSPSDTASMYNNNIIAFATDVGGRTSHTAIMAKTLGIPAVVGIKDATLHVRNQDFIIIDGRKGLIIINPEAETKNYYQRAKDRIDKNKGQYNEIKDQPSETIDGKLIPLYANLELPEEIPSVLEHRASGIGLYRTEFLFMNREDLPSEEEQFQAYKSVAESISPNPVTIRTLDIGGDKFISSLQIPKEMVLSSGWRAIRFCFEQPVIFKTQLRAILRASHYGKIKIMYPMVSGPEDLKRANVFLNEVKKGLTNAGIPFDENIQVGVMIEVPSAAMTADLLAKDADFFSIGTNDLIQYTLAVDRVNEQTAELYEPTHPGVLRLIWKTTEAAHKENIKVSLCGEMANEPMLAFLLIGLGVDELSMSSKSILQIKNLVRKIKYSDANNLAKQVLNLSSGVEVEELCQTKIKQLIPDFVASGQEER